VSKKHTDPLRMPVALPAVALSATGSLLLGFWIGVPWLVPILNAAPAHAVMSWCLLRGARRKAVGLMLWWALWMAIAATALIAADPWGNASAVVIHGADYAAEMQRWVATGIGCESTPSCFVPQQLFHAALFSVLALATASVAALTMGSILMNYMSFYVASVASASARPMLTAVLGWHPWAIVRIISFVILGVILAEPLLCRLGKRPAMAGRLPWILVAVGGLAADILIKTLLAPTWSELLRRIVAG